MKNFYTGHLQHLGYNKEDFAKHFTSGALAAVIYALATVPYTAELFAVYQDEYPDLCDSATKLEAKLGKLVVKGLDTTLEVAKLVTNAVIQDPSSGYSTQLSRDVRELLKRYNSPELVLEIILNNVQSLRKAAYNTTNSKLESLELVDTLTLLCDRRETKTRFNYITAVLKVRLLFWSMLGEPRLYFKMTNCRLL